MKRVLMLGVVFGLVATAAFAEGLDGPLQQVMDIVVSILKQLMAVAVEFIRLVLAEIVNAIQSLLPGFTSDK